MQRFATLLTLIWLAGCAGPGEVHEAGRHITQLALKNCQPAQFDHGPVLLHGTAPHLPMFDAGRPGNRIVRVTFTINANGTTQGIEVETEASPAYAAHTSSAVAEWVFTPATSGGEPISTRCEVLLTFDAWRRPVHLSDPDGSWRR